MVMLRSRLGVDSGQMSRMLRALEADGLVIVTPSDADARVRVARLTEKGLAERAILDERSDELAASILEPLAERQREELVASHADGRAADRDFAGRAARGRPRGAATLSAACARTSPSSTAARRTADSTRRKGSTADPYEVRPPLGAFVVAYLRGEPIGCGAVKHHPWRGRDRHQADVDRGVGARPRPRPPAARAPRGPRPRARVRARPASRPSDVLAEAIALYRSAGYVEVPPFNDEPFADRWFAKPLLGDGQI